MPSLMVRDGDPLVPEGPDVGVEGEEGWGEEDNGACGVVNGEGESGVGPTSSLAGGPKGGRGEEVLLVGMDCGVGAAVVDFGRLFTTSFSAEFAVSSFSAEFAMSAFPPPVVRFSPDDAPGTPPLGAAGAAPPPVVAAAPVVAAVVAAADAPGTPPVLGAAAHDSAPPPISPVEAYAPPLEAHHTW